MNWQKVSLRACGLLIWNCGAAWIAPALAAECDNALNPVQNAWVWTYRVMPGDTKKPASSYSLSRTATDTGFQEQLASAGKPANTSKYKCTAGAHTTLTPPQLGDIRLTRAAVSGTGVADAQTWKPGAAWSLIWDLEGKQGLLSGRATLTASRQVLGREKVTVPAGTFDAWKVRGVLRVVGKLGPVPLNRDLGEFSEWYAEGVGLVKSQSGYGLTELLTLKK
ncbi:TapB family protein [Deinococcus arenicola]|uniref:DUF3108 domain-containing protein n=1 Tax=Deinococcus arenicola TaxID=2994950 RepID=A0ABU4DPF4_9DEIO|nr:hypothetical protein [Deinococcus sp. ZS9-10]MDV6374318.1 hypothetical protein [Deinococcus sp. ZS9-10]